MTPWALGRAKHPLRLVRDQLYLRSGVLALAQRRMRAGLTVLTYHRVLPSAACQDYPFPSMAVSTEVFEQELEWLARECEVLPLGEAEHALSTKRRARPLVALTFDDGYADNCELAAPLLEHAGLRATFFVATDFVERCEPLWFDTVAACLIALGRAPSIEAQVAGLKRLGASERARSVQALMLEAGHASKPGQLASVLTRFRALSIPQVQQLARAGHEIASHTASHALLTGLSDQRVLAELARARAALQCWTGRAPAGLAYPNGDCDARIARLAAKAGHEYACSTRLGRHAFGADRMRIPRVHVACPAGALPGDFSSAGFRCRISLLGSMLRRPA